MTVNDSSLLLKAVLLATLLVILIPRRKKTLDLPQFKPKSVKCKIWNLAIWNWISTTFCVPPWIKYFARLDLMLTLHGRNGRKYFSCPESVILSKLVRENIRKSWIDADIVNLWKEKRSLRKKALKHHYWTNCEKFSNLVRCTVSKLYIIFGRPK